MKYIRKLLGILSLLSIFSFAFGQERETTKDFSDILDIEIRKQEFIKTMIPLIEDTNKKISLEREFVSNFFDKVEKNGINSMSIVEKTKMELLAKKYRINSIELKNRSLFEKRIALIPVSLAIAQAALESGWGTSRFFKEANNIFGQWTWSNKDSDGLIPENRVEGKTHRVKIFKTLQDSVDAYALNLNRNNAYKEFRNERALQQDNFNGIFAAETMINYSETREEYINLLKSVMNANKLLVYDDNKTKKEDQASSNFIASA